MPFTVSSLKPVLIPADLIMEHREIVIGNAQTVTSVELIDNYVKVLIASNYLRSWLNFFVCAPVVEFTCLQDYEGDLMHDVQFECACFDLIVKRPLRDYLSRACPLASHASHASHASLPRMSSTDEASREKA